MDTVDELRFVAPLRQRCEDVIAIPLPGFRARLRGLLGLLGGGTLTESFYRHASMTLAVRRWSRSVKFDVVVAFSSGMAPYTLEVSATRRVVDFCDLDSQKWLDYAAKSRWPLRPLYRMEGRRLFQRERYWVDTLDAAMVITEAEARPLVSHVGTRKVHVVGNGVSLGDRSLINPGQAPAETSDSAGRECVDAGRRYPSTASMDARKDSPTSVSSSEAPIVGFIGVMSYRPNVDACRWFVARCWPLIRAASPRAIFRIIGRSPSRSVRRLGIVPGVEVVGEVEDVGTELAGLDVSVAPLRIARGLQNKVLEAMAAMKPVVLSGQAATGIGARHGRDYVVADGAEDFSKAVIDLLRSPDVRRSVGLAGRRFVATHHRWDEVLRRFEFIVTGVQQRLSRADGVLVAPTTRGTTDDVGAGTDSPASASSRLE